MFALFEAGNQVIRLYLKPQVTSLRSSPGANRVAPLRGAEVLSISPYGGNLPLPFGEGIKGKGSIYRRLQHIR